MPRWIEAQYDQLHLLPPALEDWVGPEHPARYVREVVGELDLERLGFTMPQEGLLGRPAYSPRILLALWLFGYMNGVRSSRGLEAAARERMGFVWLCGNQAPDHNSLWRFWAANQKPLRQVFKATVTLAARAGMVGMALQAIDGTKVQAASSSLGGWDERALEGALARLEERIVELEAAVAQAGEVEAALPPEPALAELLKAGQLREQVIAALAQVQAGERNFAHPQEPEAERMKSGNLSGKPFSYNAQAVVDAQARIITAADVTSEVNDDNQAVPMMEQAEANTAGASAEAVSLVDGGYFSTETLRQAEHDKRALLCPLPQPTANAAGHPYHTSRFSYNPGDDAVTCPQKRQLPFTRTRLKGKNQVPVRVYRSAATCAGCPVRSLCTRDRHGRTIEIYPGTAALERHRTKMQSEANLLTLRLRKQIVEPVFGWIKAHDGFRRFTVRGLSKARTQWALICAARNLRTLWRSGLQLRLPPPQANTPHQLQPHSPLSYALKFLLKSS